MSPPQDYAAALGARLRTVRMQRGLTLQGVQRESAGRWKAVVVGSYERGERAVTVVNLAGLAEFYGVPTEELLPGDAPTPAAGTPNMVIDLQRLAALPVVDAGPLARYAVAIQSQRDQANPALLAIREEDLRSLAVVYDLRPNTLFELFLSWGVLAADTTAAEKTFAPAGTAMKRT